MAEENITPNVNLESITPTLGFLPPEKSGLVDLDLNKMRRDGFNDSSIAKFVLSQYKPRAEDGSYFDLDEGYYDALKRGMPGNQTLSGNPLRPQTDKEIIARYSAWLFVNPGFSVKSDSPVSFTKNPYPDFAPPEPST